MTATSNAPIFIIALILRITQTVSGFLAVFIAPGAIYYLLRPAPEPWETGLTTANYEARWGLLAMSITLGLVWYLLRTITTPKRVDAQS